MDAWMPASLSPVLTAATVHVYRFSLDLDGETLERMAAWLDTAETARLQRLRRERDRRRFIARRGRLRLILSRYLGLSPAALTYEYGEHGRPRLVSEALEFNASHSAGLGLVGVASRGTLGVDIERIRPGVEHTEIARRYFSAAEQAQLAGLPPEQRLAAFFRCWTRKEAYLKALGSGLLLPLDGFDVSLQVDQPARLLAARNGLPGPDALDLHDLQAADGFAAALCAPIEITKIEYWVEPAD